MKPFDYDIIDRKLDETIKVMTLREIFKNEVYDYEHDGKNTYVFVHHPYKPDVVYSYRKSYFKKVFYSYYSHN